MVSLQAVRANNSALKELGPGLVAVFVGGTSGIGESTAREFARNTDSPRVYLVGRNQAEATRITQELQKLNPEGKFHFIKSDLSLLRNVDVACKEIQAKEEKINLLFLSCGYLTMKGREETPEGLDRKFSLNYYARMRFAQNLLPQLSAASQSNTLSRVVSVLDPNARGSLVLDDLSLKTHFSLSNCATHACTMNNLAVEELAATNPGISFVHAFPGLVKTGVTRGYGPILQTGMAALFVLLKPFTVPLGESGERHLYAATSKTFSPKSKPEESAAVGSTGEKGSGAYWLNWNGDPYGGVPAKMKGYQEKGIGKQVWEHTQDVFQKVCQEGGKY
ncbi:NAD(P)-binding protein [Lepidopterella palustris CBS 459.81]|uniref:NAD(P)-binding protein n=1 Tax=Lepidopterella palustris CBS 459.81 TaxID=1314670 RepID=A0A8E2EH09_9PEZI|nr:NAD(P)-binding protein [Lepidopterella palustris CBS 459.81]